MVRYEHNILTGEHAPEVRVLRLILRTDRIMLWTEYL